MNEEAHTWLVGDLCTCHYGGIGEGMVYRVVEVNDRGKNPRNDHPILKIVPVYGVLTNISFRRPRTLSGAYCVFVELVTLGTEYLKLGNFIQGEAKRCGAGEET